MHENYGAVWRPESFPMPKYHPWSGSGYRRADHPQPGHTRAVAGGGFMVLLRLGSDLLKKTVEIPAARIESYFLVSLRVWCSQIQAT